MWTCWYCRSEASVGGPPGGGSRYLHAAMAMVVSMVVCGEVTDGK